MDVAAIPPITRDEAARLATTEGQRYLDLVRSLDGDDWNQPTDCERWTVRDVVAHTLGAAEGVASMREMVRQFRNGPRVAKELGLAEPLDGLNEFQVIERRDLTNEELVARLTNAEPRMRRGRRRARGPLRRIPLSAPGGRRIRVGWLMDVIYTRDFWMHRVDIATATRRQLELTADHDGRLIADIVREWANGHRQPFRLTLGGPAGASFQSGSDGPHLELDAAEFARTVSGRLPGEGLLATTVLF